MGRLRALTGLPGPPEPLTPHPAKHHGKAALWIVGSLLGLEFVAVGRDDGSDGGGGCCGVI